MGDPGRFVMPLGKYRGQTLDDIAASDEGLRYLDWMIGQEWVYGSTKAALKAYLEQPAIARELENLIDD